MDIFNFSKVDKNLYRGGAPLPSDVEQLYKKYNIKNIISLDKQAGRHIRNICKKLHINHIEIPIDGNVNNNTIKKLIKVLSNIESPTYIHCKWGKDRTGMSVAIYRGIHGWNLEDAFKEADKFHFGRGLKDSVLKSYKDAVKSAYDFFNKKDSNSLSDDIVTQQRDFFDKGLTPPAFVPQQSFSPFLDPEVIYSPYATGNSSYALKNDFNQIIKLAQKNKRSYQFDNDEIDKIKNSERKNKLKKLLLTLLRYIDSDEQISSIETKDSYMIPPSDIPQVGQYDNYSGVKGSGPSETGGYAQL